jgi:hypothetical protein
MALSCRIQILLSRARAGAAEDARRAVEAATEIAAPRAAMIAGVYAADVTAEPWAFEPMQLHVSHAASIHASLGTRFFSANMMSWEGWIALLDGDEAAAADLFDRAQAPGLAPLDRRWAARTEFLAWESVAAADRMIAVAERSIPALDAPVWSVWLSVARAVGLALRREWDDALEVASPALAEAEAVLELRAARRLARVAWLALDALGRREEAERMRARAVDAARKVADAIDDELRPGFLARPDVADVLGA